MVKLKYNPHKKELEAAKTVQVLFYVVYKKEKVFISYLVFHLPSG